MAAAPMCSSSMYLRMASRSAAESLGSFARKGAKNPAAIIFFTRGQEDLVQPEIVLRVGEREDGLVDHQEVLVARPVVLRQNLGAHIQYFDGHATAAMPVGFRRRLLPSAAVHIGALEGRRIRKPDDRGELPARLREQPDLQFRRNIGVDGEPGLDAAVRFWMHAPAHRLRRRIALCRSSTVSRAVSSIWRASRSASSTCSNGQRGMRVVTVSLLTSRERAGQFRLRARVGEKGR